MNTTEFREITAEELRGVDGGIASFIPGLNPVVTLAARPALPTSSTAAIRADEYVRNYG